VERPTIIDIARRVGVSKAAVSYALNGRAGVSAATRERILEVAAQLGWESGAPARPMTHDRSGTVGVVLAGSPEALCADGPALDWTAGAEAALAEHGLSLQVAFMPDGETELATYRRWWTERRVDGVLVPDLRTGDPRVRLLRELGMPAVLVGARDRAGEIAVLRTREDEEARAVVAHLAGLGHRRIGHVRVRSDLARHRLRAAALDQSTVEATGAGCATAEISGAGAGNTETAAAQATWRLLAADRPPTAIVYDNDRMAVAAVARSAELGVRVPADLAVLSWQDSMLCRVVTPAVTALSRDAGRDAEAAVRLLLELIETGAADDSDLPAGVLVPRASTAGESG